MDRREAAVSRRIEAWPLSRQQDGRDSECLHRMAYYATSSPGHHGHAKALMRILIVGGTGVIGRYLVPLLVSQGHEIVVTARNDTSARLAEQLGARSVRADIFSRDTLDAACAGADAVIHAATQIPRTFPGKPAEFATNDRIRREGTTNLLAAARAAGITRVVGQSIVWVHGDQHGAWIDESAPLKPGRLTQSAVEMEAQLRRHADETGARVHILRCGGLYAAEAYHTREIIDRLKKRLVPLIGRADNYQDFVHAADAASAFAAAATADAPSGTWFVTDDEPVTLGNYLKWLARAVGAPEPIQVPPFMARVALGSEMLEAYQASLRCRNTRFKEQFGWLPKYPSYRDGYAEILPRL